MLFDVLILGGGVAGVSCALVLGSAKNKPFAADKHIAIIAHQKASSLQDAVFNNAYGIAPGTTGASLLKESTAQLNTLYPHVIQINGEKVCEIKGEFPHFTVLTNKNVYETMRIVVAVGYSNSISIVGLEKYVIPHQKAAPEKQRIQLKNEDHLVAPGLYVVGNLAGWRSQLSIAAGSGAAVATDILTEWNEGKQSQSHDKVQKQF